MIPRRTRSFLDSFPDRDRSTISNTFLAVIRKAPGADAYDVVRAVRRETIAWRYRKGREALGALLFTAANELDPEALAYAEDRIAWVKLPQEERDRRVAEIREEEKLRYMSGLRITEKQRGFLRRLGVPEPDIPEDRALASLLIDTRLKEAGP